MSLNDSKKKENIDDEFYTRFEDINVELQHYTDYFKNKIIYCNCDDGQWSNFWKFFYVNFEAFELKKLIATSYHDGISRTNDAEDIAYEYIYEGGYEKSDYVKNNFLEGVTKIKLNQDGDFRSEECIKLLDESDIVVTNPPFSLFRDFLDMLIKHNKQFIFIGNMNAVINKDTFPYIKSGELHLGYTSPTKYERPNGTIKSVPGKWYTNLPTYKSTHITEYYARYDENKYAKYADYEGIDCVHGNDIPCDYTGIIGVPSTYIENINTKQFEILDHHEPAIELNEYCKFYTPHESRQKKVKGVLCNKTFHRIFIRWRPEFMPTIDEDGVILYGSKKEN